MIWTNTPQEALNELSTVPLVRFSVLALSSIFFLVDPFAAIPGFLAITHNADAARRKRMARKGAITAFIVLTTFAVAGQLIFKMFGITLPAFEIAGGLILLLIGLDMLEARRSATQETHGDTEEATAKEDAGIVPLGIPMLAGPGAISSVMVLVGQVPSLLHWEMAAILGSITVTALVTYWVLAAAGRVRQGRWARRGIPDSGSNHGAAAGCAGHAVLCERNYRFRADPEALSAGFEAQLFERTAKGVLFASLSRCVHPKSNYRDRGHNVQASQHVAWNRLLRQGSTPIAWAYPRKERTEEGAP